MSRALTEYSNKELLEAVSASATHVGYPYHHILAEMNRRVLAYEAKVTALKVWTVVTMALPVLMFITQPTYIGGMGPSPIPPWITPLLSVVVVWLVGVVVLLVAGRLGAFRRADPSTASGPGETTDGPPPEPPAFVLTWDWRKRH